MEGGGCGSAKHILVERGSPHRFSKFTSLQYKIFIISTKHLGVQGSCSDTHLFRRLCVALDFSRSRTGRQRKLRHIPLLRAHACLAKICQAVLDQCAEMINALHAVLKIIDNQSEYGICMTLYIY